MPFYGLVPEGTGGHLVTIEARVKLNAPTKPDASLDIRLTGLPQAPLRQALPRWQSALEACNLSYPKFEVIINLAPANLPMRDTTLEAAIVAFLAVLGHNAGEPEKSANVEDEENITAEIRAKNTKRQERLERILSTDWVIIGELSLTGALKNTRSLLGMILKAPKGANIIVSREAEKEASMLLFKDNSAKVFCASNLNEVVNLILGEASIRPIQNDLNAIKARLTKDFDRNSVTDLKNVAGQDSAKRAIEIAVAGGHSVLLFGPPGEGKTMLAKAIPSIMPGLTGTEFYQINQIYSSKGLLKEGHIKTIRPFRQVHSTATKINLIGGIGMSGEIEPGEVSLAHQGVLFMDELPQFNGDILEHLRAPLSEKKVVIGRASGSIEFLCNFALVAAMNPCLCGFYGEYKCSNCLKTVWHGVCEDHPEAETIHKCNCTKARVDSYLKRLSGPFLDRIDLKVRIYSLNPAQRFNNNSGETSKTVKARIKKARERQASRFKDTLFSVNAEVENPCDCLQLFKLGDKDMRQFEQIQGEKNLSTRGAVKVLQVGRTIADLEDKEDMSIDHILQAMGFMGSSFNEAEIQINMETSLRTVGVDPTNINYLKERILGELGRRRLSENRCAQEMDLSILTFKKIMRSETNISSGTMNKIIAWLKESENKTFRNSRQ